MHLSFVESDNTTFIMLTTPEVARMLKITPGRVHQLLPRMRKKPRKVGTVRLWTGADVAEFERVRRPTGRPRGRGPGKPARR